MNAAVEMLSLAEAIDLGAEDGAVYARYFFPRAVRQSAPLFHNVVWATFSQNRFESAKIFRGGAKTTIARQFTSRGIAYGMAHTVLFISESEEHATDSVIWLKDQVEYNGLS